jgi:hypothetical protein
MPDPIQYEFLFLFTTLPVAYPEPEPKLRYSGSSAGSARPKVLAPCGSGSATLIIRQESDSLPELRQKVGFSQVSSHERRVSKNGFRTKVRVLNTFVS